MPADWLLLALGAAVGGFVQGLSGFAFGMVAMSFWVWGIEPHVATVMVLVGGVAGQLLATFSLRRAPPWAMLLPMLAGAALGIPLGMWLLHWVNAAMFKLFFGALLVLWCPLMLVSQRLPNLPSTSRWAEGAVGVGSGVLGGLGGFTGVLPSLWCALRGFDKEQQRTLIQYFNLTTLSATLLAYLGTGGVSREMWPMFAIVVPALLLPNVLGARIYIGLSDVAFRRIVLVLLTASGLAMVVAALPQLMRQGH